MQPLAFFVHYIVISMYIRATDEEHPSLSTSLDPNQLLELTLNMEELWTNDL